MPSTDDRESWRNIEASRPTVSARDCKIEQARRDEVEHVGIVLVHDTPAPANDVERRLPLRAPGLHHLADDADRVTGTNRREPFEIVESRRAERFRSAQRAFDDEAHRDAAGLPSRGDQAVPASLLRTLDIGVKSLRIVVARERDDFRFRNARGSESQNLSRVKVGESHLMPDARRAPYGGARLRAR